MCHGTNTLNKVSFFNSLISCTSKLLFIDLSVSMPYHHSYNITTKSGMAMIYVMNNINFHSLFNRAYLNYQNQLLFKYMTIYFYNNRKRTK